MVSGPLHTSSGSPQIGAPDESILCMVADGGGTKTRCQIVRFVNNAPDVLGMGESTGSNPAEIGVQQACNAIQEAFRKAFGETGLDPACCIDRAALAIAGTLDDSLRTQLEDQLRLHSPTRCCRVFPDVLPYALAQPEAEQSLAIVAGTGSVAIARCAENDFTLVGGWGYLLGDEGSGYAIGRHALRHALYQLEAKQSPSLLTKLVLEHLSAKTASHLKCRVYRDRLPRRTIAAIARIVVDAHQMGDAESGKLLRSSSQDLAQLACRSSSTLHASWETVPIAVAGGLFSKGGPMLAMFKQAVSSLGHASEVRWLEDSLATCQLLLRDDIYQSEFSIRT